MVKKLQNCIILVMIIFTSSVQAGEEDLYDFLWLDPDKTVYVLQNKIYPKDKSFYADFGYVTSLTSTFQDTNGGQLKLGYFFSEDWGVEYNLIQYANTDNSNHDNIQFVAQVAPFVRRPLSSNSLFLIYSPFYGKINTFNKIYYFDVSFGLGTGRYVTESNLKTAPFKDRDEYERETFTPIQLKAGAKLHINKNFHIGVEFLSTNFNANSDPKDQSKKSWKRNNDLIFSLGVSF